MTEHPGLHELQAFARGELPAKRAHEVILHLFLRPCAACLAEAPPELLLMTGWEGPLPEPELTADEDRALDDAIGRAIAGARKEKRRLRRQETDTAEALAILETGGLQALEKVPRRIKGLPLFEALLARSWSLRHDNPRLMVQFAWLAVYAAGDLKPEEHGHKRAMDYHCRAWAALGNASRVADQLDEAESALARAMEIYEQGTGDQDLGIHLLDLQASLAADRRQFELACEALSLIHKHHLKNGNRHLAGRALISRGLYTGYAGDLEEAIRLLQEGFAMIDDSDPVLAFAAVYNQLWFQVECGQLQEAKKFLFRNRRHCTAPVGEVNRLKLSWLEARIDAGMNQLERAVERLREVREGFAAAGLPYNGSICALDQAAALLALGRTDEARAIVLEAVGVFVSLRVHREAMGAVMMLRKAFEMSEERVELIEEVASYLRLVQHNPRIHFDPQARLRK